MKINDIFEQQTEDQEQIIQNTVSVLLNDCQPFLEQIDYNLFRYPLYKGVKTSGIPVDQTVLERKEINQRSPKDTPLHKHQLIDAMFESQFGIKFRSNSFFATSDINQAFDYGKPQYVIPIHTFQYVWSPQIGDLYNYDIPSFFASMIGDDFNVGGKSEKGYIAKLARQYIEGQIPEHKLQKTFSKMVTKLGYRSTNIKKAIKSGNEIMVASNYYQFPYNGPDDKMRDQIFIRVYNKDPLGNKRQK